MTYPLIIALNVILSILALAVVYGSVLLAHRLSDGEVLQGDWRNWGQSLPVAVAAEEAEAQEDRELVYYATAA